HLATSPWRLVPVLGRTVSGATRAAVRLVRGRRRRRPSLVVPAPRVPWSGEVTARRNVAYMSMPLDDVRRIAKDADVKVNDVVLSIFGGALRRYLQARHALPASALVAGVPVSVQGDDDLGGDRLSAMFVTLGT